MNIQLCKAKEEDFSYIQEKIKNYILDPTGIELRQFFVARMNAKTVAFGRIVDHGDFFEIASLGVDYYHRGKGLGQRMLSHLVQEARGIYPPKPIYGVTHIKQFLIGCGFVVVESNYPAYLDYKRRHICRLNESRFSVMKWGAKK